MRVLTLLLLFFSTVTFAAPTLVGDPLPSSGPQPTSASITVNGSAGPSCTLPKATDGSVQMRCDLAALTSPGVYTLVASYVYVAGCTNSTNAATCTDGGTVASSPFVLTRQAGAAKPTLSVTP